MSLLDGVALNSLTSAIQAGELNQQVLANNIANVNTPNYKEQSVQFAPLLQSALAAAGYNANGAPGSAGLTMAADSPADLGGVFSPAVIVNPVVTTDSSTSVSSNGNNVNLDAQMSALAENQINYGALVQELTDQFMMLKTAITG